MRRRTLLYVLLALTVPLPAFALSGEGEPAQASLSVSASLDGCGIAGDGVVCKIDASWNQLPGATRYAANITRPDGSVMDVGDVGAGSGSFWVPYAGNGTYTLTVSAYGTPPGSEHSELIAKDSSSADGDGGGEAHGQSVGTAEQATDAEPDGEPGAGSPTEPTEPDCEPEPEPDPEPEEPDEKRSEDEPESTDAAAESSAEAEATPEEDHKAAPAEPGECAEAETAP